MVFQNLNCDFLCHCQETSFTRFFSIFIPEKICDNHIKNFHAENTKILLRVMRALYPDIMTRYLEIDILYRILNFFTKYRNNETNRIREIFQLKFFIIISFSLIFLQVNYFYLIFLFN